MTMRTQLLSTGLAAMTALAAITLSPAAHAVLGGAASTVQEDRINMKAAVPATTTKLNYTIHEMVLPSGTTVREYIAGEKVFAVAWRGRNMPDLKQLMGSYFDTYAREAHANHNGHTHVSVNHPEFVMRATGHMRSFTGSAYIPGMLPEGVSADDIH